MVLLVQRLGLSLKHSLKNHHNHHHHHMSKAEETALASLQVFKSDVSNHFIRLSGNSKPGLEFLSMKWVHQCFELLPIVNTAFSKLVVEIDYPMSQWEGDSVEEYLNYSINLLELLNLVSSSLSHLSQARVSLSYALSLTENSPALAIERMKEIPSKNTIKDFKVDDQERICSGNEWIIHQALLVLKSTGLWVCRVVLSCLNSNSSPYIEMRKQLVNGFCVDSSLMGLDLIVGKEIEEKRGVVKEVKQVNETVGCFVSGMSNRKDDNGAAVAKEELQTLLEGLDKALKGLGEEKDRLFSNVLAVRNELLDILRRKNH